ncbi:MAG: Sec-independent protein translocase protein tatA/E-like protein [Firmicutes bacterium]|nr:Sec-independent protein translocase protein tatA/E-like protein [Bacillota bacterium]
MLNFSMPELGIILVIALIVFGPGKLPEVGKALGKGIGEFRRSVSGESSNQDVIKIEGKPAENKPGETK